MVTELTINLWRIFLWHFSFLWKHWQLLFKAFQADYISFFCAEFFTLFVKSFWDLAQKAWNKDTWYHNRNVLPCHRKEFYYCDIFYDKSMLFHNNYLIFQLLTNNVFVFINFLRKLFRWKTPYFSSSSLFSFF